MAYKLSLEVHFYTGDAVAVCPVHTPEDEAEAALPLLFSCFTCWQLAHMEKGPIALSLAKLLTIAAELSEDGQSDYWQSRLRPFPGRPGRYIFRAGLRESAEAPDFFLEGVGNLQLPGELDCLRAISVEMTLQHFLEHPADGDQARRVAEVAQRIGRRYLDARISVDNAVEAANEVWAETLSEERSGGGKSLGPGDSRAGTEQRGDRESRLFCQTFWNLRAGAKERMLPEYFLRFGVEEEAAGLIAEFSQELPALERILRSQQRRDRFRGELGALVIEGYIAGRLSLDLRDGISRAAPIRFDKGKTRAREMHRKVAEMKDWKPDSAPLAILLKELVEHRKNLAMFREIRNLGSAEEVITRALLCGVRWANAEAGTLRRPAQP